MKIEEARYLFRYTAWANAQVLDAAARLSSEEFTRDLGNSFPSVRDTLVHLLYAEWVWLARWEGESPREVSDPAEYADVEAVRAGLADVERRREALLAGVDDAALDGAITYANSKGELWRYPLGSMMRHVVNHSAYHRGQIVTMLRQLGHSAPSTDLLIYVDETEGGRTRVGP
ncbi:MAG: DinB family protein [Acidobacteriota bacterium]|nr:DinB family protein [Acidobacteriota bacterium]